MEYSLETEKVGTNTATLCLGHGAAHPAQLPGFRGLDGAAKRIKSMQNRSQVEVLPAGVAHRSVG